MAELRRILIIKPSSLGDVATALPMLCDLKAAYPGAEIDWLVAPAFAALVQGHDAIHEVILFDRKGMSTWWRSGSAFGKLRELKRRLKSAQYDCVIDAQGLLRSGYLSYVTGAKLRIGFADAREGGSLFYTHKVPIRRREAMAVVRMRALLEPLEIPHDGAVEYRVPIDAAAREKMAGIVPEGAVGFIPGCRGEGKRWKPLGFATVEATFREHGRPVVLFGTADERPLCEEIIRLDSFLVRSDQPLINLAGQTSIAEMTAALNRCSLIIGNDTGPLHVAVALNKPIVGLYGRTDPKSVGPYGQLENVVRFNENSNKDVLVEKEVLVRAEKILETDLGMSTESA